MAILDSRFLAACGSEKIVKIVVPDPRRDPPKEKQSRYGRDPRHGRRRDLPADVAVVLVLIPFNLQTKSPDKVPLPCAARSE